MEYICMYVDDDVGIMWNGMGDWLDVERVVGCLDLAKYMTYKRDVLLLSLMRQIVIINGEKVI